MRASTFNERGCPMSDTCPVCRASVQPHMESCPQCGFKLLGATQKFQPLSLDDNVAKSAREPQRSAALEMIRGPQAGVTYHLDGDELTIGRSPQCSIFLNDMTVSRMHATLRREDGCYVIRDENSYNGVWVNNRNVEAKALATGDFIQIGTFCLRFEESPAE